MKQNHSSSFSFISNKTFNKRKNRALLTVRGSRKHYEIFSNNVLPKNISRKQLRLETIEIAWFRVGSVSELPRFYFFPRKLNHCFWRGKHDLIYYRLFSALKIPFRLQNHLLFCTDTKI